MQGTELFIWACVGVIGGALIGQWKNRLATGALLGLLLGVIGWVIIALMKPVPRSAGPGERVCPFCAEPIRTEAIVCRHCGRDLAPTGTWPPSPPA